MPESRGNINEILEEYRRLIVKQARYKAVQIVLETLLSIFGAILLIGPLAGAEGIWTMLIAFPVTLGLLLLVRRQFGKTRAECQPLEKILKEGHES